MENEHFWVCIVCGWEGDPDKVGKFCPCGERDLDAEDCCGNGTLSSED